jgi:hypothetical protein
MSAAFSRKGPQSDWLGPYRAAHAMAAWGAGSASDVRESSIQAGRGRHRREPLRAR